MDSKSRKEVPRTCSPLTMHYIHCSRFLVRFYRKHSGKRYGRFVSLKRSAGLRKCDDALQWKTLLTINGFRRFAGMKTRALSNLCYSCSEPCCSETFIRILFQVPSIYIVGHLSSRPSDLSMLGHIHYTLTKNQSKSRSIRAKQSLAMSNQSSLDTWFLQTFYASLSFIVSII